VRISAAIKLAVAGPALALGLALAIPAAAGATTAAPGAHAVVNSPGAVHPDISNFTTYTGSGETGSTDAYQCDQGFDYNPGNAIILNPVLSVRNNCEYRVYLQYANGTSDCVNPHTTRNIVDVSFQDPDGVMIGNSEDNC
jgi:hypothetical protein